MTAIPQSITELVEVLAAMPGTVAVVLNIRIDFESKYDGSEVGLVAWTGKGPSLNLTMPVKEPRRR